MTIEWYPGHMSKARRQIAEVILTFDVIIEVLDARLPAASANPLLEKLRQDKPCIKVLNKNDLADPAVTKAWVRHFEQRTGVRALPLEARQRKEAGAIPKLCRTLAPHRGKPGSPLRAMVIGIPNVGKSTLINTLAGRRIARVGDKPAITTCPQQIDLRNGIFLSDTPGLLWPIMDDQAGAYRLATSGAIGDSAMDYADVAHFAAAYMVQRYPELVRGRYKLEEMPGSPTELLEEIGRRRGCLVGGGEIDLHRAAEVFLRELRGGKIGRVSLEEPGGEVAPRK
ncbi:MAG: ribosome biogenesis GTPase YlqF [Desulfuromonas sp.]|uniref:ribosome biogenesis GTPase YlqF n=1 Tax=Desulfuromonas sp. TaxID=892 RepID=UPI000CC92C50|nr:ribosome biogenesis GTPase YlqF [Desulfuromonas sp.]PLX82208.1 MAG: ribosome biogenesis GTPase YlqF [Desulfuromonas sp.]